MAAAGAVAAVAAAAAGGIAAKTRSRLTLPVSGHVVPSATRARRPRRRFVKRLRRWAARRLVGLAAAVVPVAYAAYMRLVDATSRHDDTLLTELLRGCVDRHDRAIAVLWHQEVFTVAWNYRHLHGHTLASISDFGQVITAMLRRCNFVVFRGGSGSRSRKRNVLDVLIDHMRTHRRVIYGLTVDGSNGPVHVVKPGAALIARACRAPVVAVRTWYSRALTLPTWDRAQIPLPFSHRVTLASGPYWIAPDADDGAVEAFRRHLEAELLELTARADRRHDPAVPRWGFPTGWSSRWPGGRLGLAQGPYDLDPATPPPWAHRAGNPSADPVAAQQTG